jgi:hypothetical protein
MNDHDDLSSIDFGSTMKNNFFKNISFGIKEKSNLTSNDNDNDYNNDEQRQSIVKYNSLLTIFNILIQRINVINNLKGYVKRKQ